ncbi:MAG TPA: hypothetical protein VK738_04315 [Terriglobales bacterium]|jgi:hypothetical protein|nr:hypothetical protein [Terriglobales bacterium]
MPSIVVPFGQFDNAGTIATHAQALLNDQGANLYVAVAMGTQAAGQINLIPYMNVAYRKIQRSLANIGSTVFTEDDVYAIIPAMTAVDPSAVVTYQPPGDLLNPLKLWERQSGSSDDFVEMIDMTERGGLPSQMQGPALGFWEWRVDAIYFIGATQDRQIRLRYQKQLPDLIDSTSPVLIRSCRNALTFFTAALASQSRGSPLARDWDAAGQDALNAILSRDIRSRQRSPVRRRPYSSRQTPAFWY